MRSDENRVKAPITRIETDPLNQQQLILSYKRTGLTGLKDNKKTYYFRYVFYPEENSNARIAERLDPLLSILIDGHNIYIIADGQSGLGKT